VPASDIVLRKSRVLFIEWREGASQQVMLKVIWKRLAVRLAAAAAGHSVAEMMSGASCAGRTASSACQRLVAG